MVTSAKRNAAVVCRPLQRELYACRQKLPGRKNARPGIAARFAAVFPPSVSPLSLALQNIEEVVDAEGGKPALITLLNFNSPPQRPATALRFAARIAAVPLLKFAILTGTYVALWPQFPQSCRKSLGSAATQIKRQDS